MSEPKLILHFYPYLRTKGLFLCCAFIDNFCGALARKLTMKPDLYRKSDEGSSEATGSDETPQTLQQDNKSCHHSKEKRNKETHNPSRGQKIKQENKTGVCKHHQQKILS